MFFCCEHKIILKLFSHNQESNLKQVMDHEKEIHQDIQSLHSDMQTLVYENYNKFILATDTIGKVINHFTFNFK